MGIYKFVNNYKMKYIALSALGLITINKEVAGYNLVERKNNQDKLYLQMAEEDDQSESDEELDSNLVQTGKILEKAQNWGGWSPKMDEFPGTQDEYGNWVDPYKREAPAIFTGDAAD